MQQPNPIVIAYDGSENARYAVEQTGQLFAAAGRAAIVLYAWEAIELAALRRGVMGMSATANEQEADERSRLAAEQIATEGAELAREAGLDAEPRAAYGSVPVWETIVRVADEENASLIVLGSRGLRGLRSLMLGSVSHQITHQAHQPVLTIPTPALVDARRERVPQRAAGNGLD